MIDPFAVRDDALRLWAQRETARRAAIKRLLLLCIPLMFVCCPLVAMQFVIAGDLRREEFVLSLEWERVPYAVDDKATENL